MSSLNTYNTERRLSINGRNAYVSVIAEESDKNKTNKKIDDSLYLTAKPDRPRSCSPALLMNNNSTKVKLPLTADSSVDTVKPDNIIPKSMLNFSSGSSATLREKMPNKQINSAIDNEKVLTGMDRYITITKRKSSPKTSSIAPSPKQIKTNMRPQNRFAILDNQDNDMEAATTAKNYKPPPLYLREATTNTLVTTLSQLVGKDNFYVATLRKGNVYETKIQVNSEENFRTVVKCFDAEKRNYYTYQLKSAKGLIVVIKGIDSSVPTNEIKSALETEGYEVKSIHNILNRDKIPQPLFRVEIAFHVSQLKNKREVHPIYNLKYLLNRRVTVDEPIKRKGPPQCQNCQEFGHTKTYCRLPSVCVRCGDIHKSVECPHPSTDLSFRKCSNCGQKHTANYRGCEVFLRLKEKAAFRNPKYAQYQVSNFPALPKTPNKTIPMENNVVPDGKNKPSSYAQALKEGMSEPSSGFQNNIEDLIVTMNNFMTNMQNMLQQLMQNQTMLMQIILNGK